MEKEYSYLEFFQQLYRNQNRITVWEDIPSRDIVSWRRELKGKLDEILGMEQLRTMGLPYRDGTQRVEKLESVKEDGYIRIKYRMETLPGVHMPFYLLKPDSLGEGKRERAMITIPAHGANKDSVAGVISSDDIKIKMDQSPKESYGKEFVKKGYVVLCPDPPGYGERVEKYSMEDKAFLPNRKINVLGSSCKDLAQTAEALGISFQGLVLWDMMCLLDFAAGQPFIDESRIGCAGFSGGGLYTLWLAAMDERIKLAVVSGYIHGYFDSILETHLCPCNYLPKLWQYADICDIAALIAPRYLYMENGKYDILNGPRGISDPKEQGDKIRKGYQLSGSEEKVFHLVFEGNHEWYGGCYDFVNRYL